MKASRAAAAATCDIPWRRVADRRSEVFYNQIRMRAMSLATFSNRAADLGVIGTAIPMQIAWGWSGMYAWHVRRADIPQTSRGDAAAGTWIFRGGESRRHRGQDVDSPWRRVAAAPWLRRGYSVERPRDGTGTAARCSWAALFSMCFYRRPRAGASRTCTFAARTERGRVAATPRLRRGHTAETGARLRYAYFESISGGSGLSSAILDRGGGGGKVV